MEPGKEAVVKEIDGSLEGMQKVVGGYIEAVYPFDDPVALVCNEEGKFIEGMKPNRCLQLHTGEIYDIIFGTFFICLASPDSEDFESLTDDLAKKYSDKFLWPEMFQKDLDGLTVIRLAMGK